VGPTGLSVPELGVAERKPLVKSTKLASKTPSTTKSAPIVARAVIEVETFFI
jgi:hypothetical protein